MTTHPITQSWDTAIKAGDHHDASACVTICERDGIHHIIDVLTLRAEYPELKRSIINHAQHYSPTTILMEDKASGQSLLQDLKRESDLPLIPIMPRGDKLTRFASITALIEAGKVALPHEAPWLAAFEAELTGFPHARHDDQLDALTQYLLWVRARNSGAGARIRGGVMG